MISKSAKIREMLAQFDKILGINSIGLLIVLIIFYILIWFWQPSEDFWKASKELLLGIISNLVPVVIGFLAGYFVFREFNKIRTEQNNEDFTDIVAEKTSNVLSQHLVEIKSRVELGNKLVSDSLEKGIIKVCSNAEISTLGSDGLQTTKSLRVIGLGNSWLLKDTRNHQRLLQLLESKAPVVILLPDPLSQQVRERYMIDEPTTRQLDLPELALRVLKWSQIKNVYEHLDLRVVNRYPMVNVTIYDQCLFASPLLYQRRGVDNLAVMFRRPSPGAEMYEDHFQKIYQTGSEPVTDVYINRMKENFHL